MEIRYSANCPARQQPDSIGFDRARLQRLIELLDRYDLSSDSSCDSGSLRAELRALVPDLA